MESLSRILKIIYNTLQVQVLDSTNTTDRNSTNHEYLVEGVNLEDMLELCLATLQVLAVDIQVQDELIHTVGLITTVAQVGCVNDTQ